MIRNPKRMWITATVVGVMGAMFAALHPEHNVMWVTVFVVLGTIAVVADELWDRHQ